MLLKLRYDLIGWTSGLLSFSYNSLVYVNNNIIIILYYYNYNIIIIIIIAITKLSNLIGSQLP